MARARFTAIFERHGRWYVGYVPEVPGVNAQERTLPATRRSLTAALRELAEISPESLRGRGRQVEKIEVELAE
jgi:predicted RNase H-like HicB family nuclease